MHTILYLLDAQYNSLEIKWGIQSWYEQFVPILLFSAFISVVISIPIKFELFEIPVGTKLFERISKLNSITDTNISANITSLSVTILFILLATLPTLIQLAN